MRRRAILLVSLPLFVLGGVSACGSSTPVSTYRGPALSVAPAAGRPHTIFTVSGTRFAARKSLHVELDCPSYGHTKHGSWSWTAQTNRAGAFILRERVPTPKHARIAACLVYVLNITRKAAFYVSAPFHIR